MSGARLSQVEERRNQGAAPLMPDKGWKKFERRCAQGLLGTRRIPVTGERVGKRRGF